MSKFIYVLATVLTLFAACPVRADDFDQRVAAAAATIQASGSLKALDTIMPAVFAQLRAAIVAEQPKCAEVVDAMLPKLQSKMKERLHEMTDAIARLYASHFTLSELRDLEAFASTPPEKRDVESFKNSASGAKFLSLRPMLMREGAKAGMEWGQRIGAEADEEIKKELRALGFDI